MLNSSWCVNQHNCTCKILRWEAFSKVLWYIRSSKHEWWIFNLHIRYGAGERFLFLFYHSIHDICWSYFSYNKLKYRYVLNHSHTSFREETSFKSIGNVWYSTLCTSILETPDFEMPTLIFLFFSIFRGGRIWKSTN